MNNFSKNLVDARMTEISPYIDPSDKIIDIGSGNCFLDQRLQSLGLNVTPLDVTNKSKVLDITPTVYDGKEIPFPDDTFDVALLITVLHHTKNPTHILREAKRVAKRIVIMEDLYSSQIQKYATFVMDSTLNLEFFGHPHTNKTDAKWLETFDELGLSVVDKKQNNFWKIFTNGTYYLEKK